MENGKWKMENGEWKALSNSLFLISNFQFSIALNAVPNFAHSFLNDIA